MGHARTLRRMATMNLTEYAKQQGISRKTAQRWYQKGTLPHPARKVGRLVLVDVPDTPNPATTGQPHPPRTALFTDSPSRRRRNEIKEWALQHGIQVDETHCPKPPSTSSTTTLKQLLSDPTITRIITDTHPAADLISAALSAQGREFITTQPTPADHTHNTFKPRIVN